jgi:hypothetical protein
LERSCRIRGKALFRTHSICATFDGGTLRLYIDGVFNTAQSISDTGQSAQTPILIGQGIQGLVRRVRVYNNSLTAETVPANVFGAPASISLVADFDFSVVPPVDRGPSANPIALQNNATTVTVSPALTLGTRGFAAVGCRSPRIPST